MHFHFSCDCSRSYSYLAKYNCIWILCNFPFPLTNKGNNTVIAQPYLTNSLLHANVLYSLVMGRRDFQVNPKIS